MAATCFLTMIWFVVDWCLGTTFRSMGFWELWVNNILAALLLMLPFVIFRKVWFQIFCLILVDMLLMANLMYSRTYFTGIPYESYFLVWNLKDFTGSVMDSMRWRDIGFAVILLTGIIFCLRMPRDRYIPGIWPRYITMVLIFGVASFLGNHLRGGFYNAYYTMKKGCYTYSCGVPVYTVPGHILFTIMDDGDTHYSESDKLIDNWLKEHEAIAMTAKLPQGAAPKKNLIIILLESFESWPIEKQVDGMEITPYINSLLNDSNTFYAPLALTQVDAGRSIDGQLLITAGLLPTKGAAFSTRFPNTTFRTLNKALKQKHGAESMLLTVDQMITWNMGVVAQSFGYDKILDRSVWDSDEKIGNPAKLSDGSFFRQSVEKLKSENLWNEGDPKMITFVTYSGHNPFVLPDNLRDPQFDLREKGYHPTVENYLTMAHYTDSQLHTLMDYLRSRSDWEQTMVMIAGDHEGLAAQRQEILKSGMNGAELVSPGQYTPFIVVNAPVGMRYDNIFGQVDIYPTLITMLGLENYEWQGVGESLLSKKKIPAAISSMTGIVEGDTTAVDSVRLSHWKDARTISDAIIRQDYFK